MKTVPASAMVSSFLIAPPVKLDRSLPYQRAVPMFGGWLIGKEAASSWHPACRPMAYAPNRELYFLGQGKASRVAFQMRPVAK